jgi:hypothetical protein
MNIILNNPYIRFQKFEFEKFWSIIKRHDKIINSDGRLTPLKKQNR